MRVLEINAYQFSELNDKAKEKVLERYRHMNVQDDWYEWTKENWVEKLKENGFFETKIEFSGFHSQGDGASFTGEIDISKMLETFPEFKSLEMDKINLGIRDLNSRYVHEHTKRVCGEYDEWETPTEANILFESFKETIEQFRHDLCQDIYSDLQKEYEYLTSDESVIEGLSQCDFEFYEDGSVI